MTKISQIRPLLMSYGGGHAQIIANVADTLIARDCQPDIIGLTMAAAFFNRRGLPAQSVLALQDPTLAIPAEIAVMVEDAIHGQSHPDILPEETRAYFTIGLMDLVQDIGLKAARAELKAKGRMAFKPVEAMVRYLERTRPDVVVTTTSPRFELSMLMAARRLGIPSLAISDLFLVNERVWIIAGPFAEHLTVISPALKAELLAAGLTDTEVHVIGNPAFDNLLAKDTDEARRAYLRNKMNLSDKTVILWPAAHIGGCGMNGVPFAGPHDLVPVFEDLCQSDQGFAYMVRHHPNSPFTLGENALHGILDDGQTLSPEDALLIADVVCTEISTMGLQAALKGIPVICVGHAENAVFPLYGMARTVANLAEMKQLLLSRDYALPSATLDAPKLGTASDAVVDLIMRIASPS